MKEYIVQEETVYGRHGAYEILNTANKVELIRCKDCKHWNEDDHECNIKTGWFACGEDWYCADGERKDE